MDKVIDISTVSGRMIVIRLFFKVKLFQSPQVMPQYGLGDRQKYHF